MAYNPIISRRQQQKPTLSALPDTQPARGSTIVLVGGDPNKTYTYVPQSDYQTISYSDTMKNKAEDYTKSKSTGERIAGNLYLGADKAASAYEEFVSPVTKTFDVTTPVNTGRPAQDFLANAGRGFINTFVSAPADIARVTGASGLSLAMLGKTNAKKGAEIVASGVPNFVGAQAESFAANPGAFVGGVAAGVVSGKAVGKVASAGKKKTGKTAANSSQKTVSGKTTPYRYKGANTRIDSSASGRKLVNKKTRRPVQQGYKNNTNSATLEKFLRQRRANDIAGDIEIGRLDRQFSNQVRQAGKITTVSTVRNAGKGRTKVVDFSTPKQQTALVTAKDARTPRNNSSRERARVARIVEVQKKSGALFQDVKLRRDPIPQRISLEKGLITATDARKPRNKTDSERRRVQRVRMEQQKSGAMKTSAATLLDLQRAGKRRRPSSSASSSGKKTTKPVRRPRAYETKVTRIERIDGVPGVYTLREVPRYAAGASRPITITKGGSVKFSGDDVILDTGFKLSLEPVRQPRLSRMPKPDKRPTGKSKGAGPKEKAKAESPTKKPAKVEYEKVDTERYVKSSSSPNKSNRSSTRKTSTHAQRKNSGPGTNKKPANTGRKTTDGKTIFRDTDGTEFVEVDAGNGMVYKVRVKPQETRTQTAAKSTTQKGKTTPVQKKQTVRRPKSKSRDKSSAPKPVQETRGAATRTRPATGQQKTFQKRQVVRVVSGGPVSASGGQQNVLVLDTGVIADMEIDDTLIDSSVIETDDTTVTQNSSTKPAVVTQTRVSSSVKSAQKEESRTTGTPRARGKPKPAPAVRPKKKPKPVKSIEEDKKKQRKKIKKMKEEAYRLETVNTFAWITDTKPAAKPRRIK